MRNLVLTGFMGTGKTTVGRMLADRFGFEFIDTDEEVKKELGSSIAEYWSRNGEKAFREIETNVFGEQIRIPGRVIASGGGTLVSERNRKLLDGDDRVVCLTCRSDVLAERLSGGGSRPLLAGIGDASQERIDELLAGRRATYDLFDQIDVTDLEPESVADEIAKRENLLTLGGVDFPGRGRSEILFGRGLLARAGELITSLSRPTNVFLITDENVEQLAWPRVVMRSLEGADIECSRFVVREGEQSKNLDTVQVIYRAAMRAGLERSSVILGLGGGVVGDIAGFVAATFLRGLRLVLTPTSLVAQADASIGGKTGVDLDDAKNLVGAFHPASLVIVDPDCLSTLPAESLSDGLAEIVKIAFMRSRSLLETLNKLSSPRQIVEETGVLRQSILEKIRIVESDPFEAGDRMLLNFGHTIGHALEAASHASDSSPGLRHGEAVSIGMLAELRVAEELGYSAAGLRPALESLLERLRLPVSAEGLDPESVLSFVYQDKKRASGELRFAIPAEAGRGEMIPISRQHAEAAIDYALERAA